MSEDFHIGQVVGFQNRLIALVVGGTPAAPELKTVNIAATFHRGSRASSFCTYAHAPDFPFPTGGDRRPFTMPSTLTLLCSSCEKVEAGDLVQPYEDQQSYRITSVTEPNPGLYEVIGEQL